MKDLNYQLSKLCRDNRDGGFSTQATRSRILDLIANQLQTLGFRRMPSTSLKPKHIDALLAHWREQRISVGTLKNRLSALRWWAKKVNKPSIIAKDNSVYGIGKRQYVAKQSKAQDLDEKKLSLISNEFVRLSIRLQAGQSDATKLPMKKLPKNVYPKGPSLYFVRKNKWTRLCRVDAPEEELHRELWKILSKGAATLFGVMDDFIVNRLPKKAMALPATER